MGEGHTPADEALPADMAKLRRLRAAGQVLVFRVLTVTRSESSGGLLLRAGDCPQTLRQAGGATQLGDRVLRDAEIRSLRQWCRCAARERSWSADADEGVFEAFAGGCVAFRYVEFEGRPALYLWPEACDDEKTLETIAGLGATSRLPAGSAGPWRALLACFRRALDRGAVAVRLEEGRSPAARVAGTWRSAVEVVGYPHGYLALTARDLTRVWRSMAAGARRPNRGPARCVVQVGGVGAVVCDFTREAGRFVLLLYRPSAAQAVSGARPPRDMPPPEAAAPLPDDAP